MTTTTVQLSLLARCAPVLRLACLSSLISMPAAHAAAPGSARNPLEAPPVLRVDAASGDGVAGAPARGDVVAAIAPAPAAQSAAVLQRDTAGPDPSTDPDWRFRLNLASAPGDRPSSATLAQRGVKLSLSRSF